MANLSHYGSDNLAEVNNLEIRANSLIHQERQVQSTSEQFSNLKHSNTKIDNKHVNDLLTAELERYKSQERVLNELKHKEKASTSYEYSQEIESLKQTLSEYLKEKEYFEQKITNLKEDLQKEESRNIDRELALEKETESYAEQAFWSQYSVQTEEPNHFGTTIVEVPKELPKVSMVDVAPLVPKLRKNRTAYYDYIRHTQEEAATLREIVESKRLLSPLNTSLDYACKYTRRIQELLMILQQTCPSITDLGTKLVPVTQMNKTKQIRHTAQITKSERKTVATSPSANIDSNTPMLSSTGVALVSSASGSKSQDNTKKNRIRQTQKKAKETELEDHLRTIKSSLNKAGVVDSKATSSVIKSVSNVNSNLKCASCNGCLLSDNHDACVVAYINSVNASKKSKSVKTPVKKKVWKSTGKVFKTVGYIWKPTGRTFILVGNVSPLTKIATATIVPLREPIPIVKSTEKPVVTLVIQIVLWYLDSGWLKHMTGDRSQLINFVQKFLGTVKFGNDHVAKIMGYGDYQIGNVTISRVYYVEGLGHNLFSIGQFCDSDLEVAFCQHTCFIRNLEGVDLLSGSWGNNLYTLSLQDRMASSLICLLSMASKTKSWLWHRRLSH
nr:hypothetical protein [Tanacetum cinerariifolium]